ncbi:unnamed protein product, partial [Cuscuta europaea]
MERLANSGHLHQHPTFCLSSIYKVEIEIDALSVVQGIKRGDGSMYLHLIIDDIMKILDSKNNFIVSF